jgi:hypothetical protein
MNKYFMYDAGDNLFDVFDTETEALAAADVALKAYRDMSQSDGEWHDCTTSIRVGRITHRVELEGDEENGFDAVLREHP